MSNTIEAKEILKYMLVFFQNIDNRLKELNEQQSEWDIKQDELLHYIENHNLNASKSCKIIKQSKYVRRERRQVKNEINIIYSLKNNFVDKYKNKFIEKDLIQAMQELRKLEKKQDNPSFTYKYITEDLEIKGERCTND